MTSRNLGKSLAVLAALASTGCGRYTFQPVQDRHAGVHQLEQSLGLEEEIIGDWTEKIFMKAFSRTDSSVYAIADDDVEVSGKELYGASADLKVSALNRTDAINDELASFRHNLKRHVIGLVGRNTDSVYDQMTDQFVNDSSVNDSAIKLIDMLAGNYGISKEDRDNLISSSVTKTPVIRPFTSVNKVPDLDADGKQKKDAEGNDLFVEVSSTTDKTYDVRKIVDEVVAYNAHSLREVQQVAQAAAWVSFLEGNLRDVNVYNRLSAAIAKSLDGVDIYVDGQVAKSLIWSTPEEQAGYQDKLEHIASEGASYITESLDNACQGPLFDLLSAAQKAHDSGKISREDFAASVYQILHDAAAAWYGASLKDFDVTKVPVGVKTGGADTSSSNWNFVPLYFFAHIPRMLTDEKFTPKSTGTFSILREAIEEGGLQMYGFTNSDYMKGDGSLKGQFFGNLFYTAALAYGVAEATKTTPAEPLPFGGGGSTGPGTGN